jgi:hypothetical protein
VFPQLLFEFFGQHINSLKLPENFQASGYFQTAQNFWAEMKTFFKHLEHV